MQLQLLHDTPPVAVYYDSVNDWIFADWRGDLTLPDVQAGCLMLAQCFLEQPYTRILNSNCDVVTMSADVPTWLVSYYFPHLRLANIEYMAWVCAPSLVVKHFTTEAASQLQTTTVAMFDDLADAYAWLQHTQAGKICESPEAAATRHAKLTNRVAAFSEELAHYQQVARLVPVNGAERPTIV